MTWPALIGQWKVLEGCFHFHYGVDLEQVIRKNRRSGRWFTVRVEQLLAEDTALARLFTPKPTEPTGDGDERRRGDHRPPPDR